MRRLKFYLSYDGTAYQGWQRQKNTRATLQEIFENKLSRICNAPISTMPSGRTDAGVHARIQVVHASVPLSAPRGERLVLGLNSLLPLDIRVLRIDEVDSGFHAIRDVEKKCYVYFINNEPSNPPELRHFAWHLHRPLDWEAIRQATEALAGRHDFKAFCASGSSAKTTVRTLFEARWGQVPWTGFALGSENDAPPLRLWALRLTGSGFLRNMVRSIVGTLVRIGSHKAPVSLIRDGLETKRRDLVGPSAPARGLWLWDVEYKPRLSRQVS